MRVIGTITAGLGFCLVLLAAGCRSGSVVGPPNPQPPASASSWSMFGGDAQHTRCSPFKGPETAKLKWVFHTTGPGFAITDPLLGPDGTIYVGAGPEVRALNPDGTAKWYSPTYWPSTAPVLAADGTVYVGSKDGNLYALNLDGSQKWLFSTGGDALYDSPVVGVDGTVYVGNSLNLHAVNPDGSQKWVFPTGGELSYSPVLGADGTVFVGELCLCQYVPSRRR